jgi:hypothetical protein
MTARNTSRNWSSGDQLCRQKRTSATEPTRQKSRDIIRDEQVAHVSNMNNMINMINMINFPEPPARLSVRRP